MSYVVAGVVSGLLMASAFVLAGQLMLFALARDPPPRLRAVLVRVPTMLLTMGLAVVAYPTWALLGAMTGLVYRASSTGAPGAGMGSPNLTYTLGVVLAAAALAAPLAVILRKVAAGVAVWAIAFIGVFGWLLPFLVA